MRVPFKGPVEWDVESLAYVREQVGEDSAAFLNQYGKPADFWSVGLGADRIAEAA